MRKKSVQFALDKKGRKIVVINQIFPYIFFSPTDIMLYFGLVHCRNSSDVEYFELWSESKESGTP